MILVASDISALNLGFFSKTYNASSCQACDPGYFFLSNNNYKIGIIDTAFMYNFHIL